MLQTLGMAVILGIWIAVTQTELVNRYVLPKPIEVWHALIDGWAEGTLPHDTWITFQEFILVLVVSYIGGLFLGILPGLRPVVDRAIGPLLGLALSIPILTYFAVVLVLFGYGFSAVLALGIIATTPTAIVSTITAFQDVDQALISVGRIYCNNPLARLTRIVVPAALPTLASGLRVASGRAMLGVIVGEIFMSSRGLGARILSASGFFDIPGYYAVAVTLATLCFIVTQVFGLIERRMLVGHQMS